MDDHLSPEKFIKAFKENKTTNLSDIIFHADLKETYNTITKLTKLLLSRTPRYFQKTLVIFDIILYEQATNIEIQVFI